jgi:hypothetical protein
LGGTQSVWMEAARRKADGESASYSCMPPVAVWVPAAAPLPANYEIQQFHGAVGAGAVR